MSFPSVDGINGGYDNTAKSSFTVTLPANIVAGNLLIVFMGIGSGTYHCTFPQGWTELFHAHKAGYFSFGCWYKVATNEGASITVTTTDLTRACWTSYRISAYSGAPEAGVLVQSVGETNIPDPPNLAPSWEAKDTLWLVCDGNYGSYTTSAYPANYTDGRTDFPNNSANVNVASARRSLNAAQENPGTFTLNHTAYWMANTVAIQPVASLSPPSLALALALTTPALAHNLKPPSLSLTLGLVAPVVSIKVLYGRQHAKVLVSHPALSCVKVYYNDELQDSYDNLSNLAEQRILSVIELPVKLPCTLEITTISGLVFTKMVT